MLAAPSSHQLPIYSSVAKWSFFCWGGQEFELTGCCLQQKVERDLMLFYLFADCRQEVNEPFVQLVTEVNLLLDFCLISETADDQEMLSPILLFLPVFNLLIYLEKEMQTCHQNTLILSSKISISLPLSFCLSAIQLTIESTIFFNLPETDRNKRSQGKLLTLGTNSWKWVHILKRKSMIELDISNNYYIRQFAMENYDQTNLEQEPPIKIKTPAALFSKSSGKSPINRLRMQPSPSQQSFLDNHCENHQNKTAAFFTKIESQKLYFCEKCAITLASQGHSITKLQQNGTNLFTSPTQTSSSGVKNSHSRSRSGQSYSRNPREVQIQNFIQQVKQMRGSIVSTKQTIKEKLIESEQFYGEQLQEINEYFSLIIKSLQLQKHKCYNHILTERQQAEQHIRNIAGELTSIDQGLTKIQMDIEDNLQTVYSIDQDMYKLVFSQYLTQQQDFQESINGLLLQPIEMRKIEFEGVPESIYNISDVVIQSSVKNQQNIQYRLADSLTSSDFNHITVVSPEKADWRVKGISESRHSNIESLKFSFEAQRLKGHLHESNWRQDGNNICY